MPHHRYDVLKPVDEARFFINFEQKYCKLAIHLLMLIVLPFSCFLLFFVLLT